MGNLSKACDSLSFKPPVAPSLEILQQLRDKHPSRSSSSPSPIPDLSSDAYIPNLDKDLFIDSLRNSPSGSAAGPWGWKTHWLKAVFCVDTDLSSASTQALSKLFDLSSWIINLTNQPDFIRFALCSARLIAIAKNDPHYGEKLDVRPVAITCPLRRLVSRALAKQLSPAFANFLSPLQFGVGLQDGLGSVIHIARSALALHPELAILKMDLSIFFGLKF